MWLQKAYLVVRPALLGVDVEHIGRYYLMKKHWNWEMKLSEGKDRMPPILYTKTSVWSRKQFSENVEGLEARCIGEESREFCSGGSPTPSPK